MSDQYIRTTGWFSIVTSKGQTAGYFGTMEEVALAQVPFFLTRDDLVGYSVPSVPLLAAPAHLAESRRSDGNRSEVIHVPGGSVLRFLGVYEDVSAFLLGTGKSSLKKHSARTRSRKRNHPPIPCIMNGVSDEHAPRARYVKCLIVATGVAARTRSATEVVFVPVTERGR